jgi:hypothetical protein
MSKVHQMLLDYLFDMFNYNVLLKDFSLVDQ